MPCVPSRSLMITGAPPTAFDGWQHVLLVGDKRRGRDADVVATENLQAPQFVARVGDSGGRIHAEDIHLLELTNQGRAKVGDRRPNSRQDRIVVRELFAPEIQIGFALLQIDCELQRVEHLHLVPALLGRLAEPAGAVAT